MKAAHILLAAGAGLAAGAAAMFVLYPRVVRAQQPPPPPNLPPLDPGPFSLAVPAGELIQVAVRFPSDRRAEALTHLSDIRIVRGGRGFFVGETLSPTARQIDFPVTRGEVAEIYTARIIDPEEALSLTEAERAALIELQDGLVSA